MGFTSLDFLDTHQHKGVKWILEHKRTYLAHAPGAGKTCQAITASILAQGKGQTLFVVPPTLTINWEREIMHWTAFSGAFPTIFIVPKSNKQENADWNADFIICPDSMISKPWVWERLARKDFKFIGVDEASRFKECQTLRTIDLFSILKRSKGYVVLLDGSPMPNRPMELWAPLIALRPDVIDNMTEHEFGVKFCNGHFKHDGYKQAWDYRGSSNENELHARLTKNFMHVVTEDELSHPERLRSLLFIEDLRTAKQKNFEQKYLKTLNLKDIDEDMSRGEIAKHRQELGLSKVDWVSKYVGERLENKNESILLFAWHRDVCAGLATRLKRFKPALVIGNTPDRERENAFTRFQRNDLKLIIGNIAAMGRGHNLQNADRVVFAEYSWTDETNIQAEKRASRKGSEKKVVRCDYCVVSNSLDEVVLNTVMNKAKTVKRIIG